MSLYAASRNRLRKFLIGRQQAADPRLAPWETSSSDSWAHCCNICGWHGQAFVGQAHSEGAVCPTCGSIARDRFLYWCWTKTVDYDPRARVLETSPRLDQRYRDVMADRVSYLASDYDESAHRASIKLDVQDIDLPSDHLDVILTPHVLEHVPDTRRALAELYRTLKPGGSLLLLIPMPQAVTAPPVTPEYHGDNTLVFWRFGWDLRNSLEAAGFDTRALVTEELIERLKSATIDSGYHGDDIDEVDLLSGADVRTLTKIASKRDARRYGFRPDFMFVCWEGIKVA